MSNQRTFWTLQRDSDGLFIRYDGGDGEERRLDSPGMILMVAWRLGMPGPLTAEDADKILAEKEVAEVNALDFLQGKIGQRGPTA